MGGCVVEHMQEKRLAVFLGGACVVGARFAGRFLIGKQPSAGFRTSLPMPSQTSHSTGGCLNGATAKKKQSAGRASAKTAAPQRARTARCCCPAHFCRAPNAHQTTAGTPIGVSNSNPSLKDYIHHRPYASKCVKPRSHKPKQLCVAPPGCASTLRGPFWWPAQCH